MVVNLLAKFVRLLPQARPRIVIDRKHVRGGCAQALGLQNRQVLPNPALVVWPAPRVATFSHQLSEFRLELGLLVPTYGLKLLALFASLASLFLATHRRGSSCSSRLEGHVRSCVETHR